jgi:hypothetical protein
MEITTQETGMVQVEATWDQARWEQEFAWAATAPTHQSHQMKARKCHGMPDRVCENCGSRDGSIGSRKPCAPDPRFVARRAEMAADRIESRRIRLAMWENLPAEMQARVVRPR